MADENGKKSVEEWRKELESLRDAKKWEELLTAAGHCIEDYPEDALGHFLRGLANSELNNHDDAILNYDEASKYAPRHPRRECSWHLD